LSAFSFACGNRIAASVIMQTAGADWVHPRIFFDVGHEWPTYVCCKGITIKNADGYRRFLLPVATASRHL